MTVSKAVQTPFAIWRQYCLPQHALSRFGGLVSHSRIPWLKNYLINWFIQRYNVDITEALHTDPNAYGSFHDFFTRQLKPGIRPIDSDPSAICSPCDGTISQVAKIKQGTLLQAKNHTFSLDALLGDSKDADLFTNGNYITIYLAPKDYHRVHMPLQGTLERMRYVPGKLFSVNPLTTNHIDNLFARNERMVAFFKHPQGTFAVILVGAMIVGSIFTQWSGYLRPTQDKKMRQIVYPQTREQRIQLDKGDELGYFALGSTVIVLLAENMEWEYTTNLNSRLVVGQRIGHFLP